MGVSSLICLTITGRGGYGYEIFYKMLAVSALGRINEGMEKDTNPFPRIDVVPGAAVVRRVGHFLLDQLHHPGLSEYHGASPALDAALFDGPNQMEFDYESDE
jgi:hypothetical protein